MRHFNPIYTRDEATHQSPVGVVRSMRIVQLFNADVHVHVRYCFDGIESITEVPFLQTQSHSVQVAAAAAAAETAVVHGQQGKQLQAF